MEQPLISIVLCTYNGERFLRQQIESILAQTYTAIELVISDDGSTDDTISIIKEYSSRHRVKYFFQKTNIGISANFSFAASKCSGDFIAFSDQDDFWLPRKLEELYGSLDGCELIYCDSELVNENLEKIGKKTSDIRKMYSGEDARCYLFYSVVWGHGMLIRRSLLEACVPFPEKPHHDIWIAFKGLTRGKIKYLDKSLTLYRQHGSSTSKTIRTYQTSRSMEKRYSDFRDQLNWMKLMSEHDRPEHRDWYSELIGHFSKRQSGKFAWPLFFFLWRNRKIVFRFSTKGLTSQLVEMVKRSRGEKQI